MRNVTSIKAIKKQHYYKKETMFEEKEYRKRIKKLQKFAAEKDLDCIVFFDYVNLFYYTGTSQNGVLVVPKEKEPFYCIRKSVERAKIESWMDALYPMRSFREINSFFEKFNLAVKKVGIGMGLIPVSIFNIFKKTLSAKTEFVDVTVDSVYLRSVKSEKEIVLLKTAGNNQKVVFDSIPELIEPGITEWQLAVKIRSKMMELGDAGLTRFSSFNGLLGGGNVSFGNSANYPTSFDGPGGIKGLCQALPITGADKKIGKDIPLYIDFVFSHQGYFVDRTRIFCLGQLDKRLIKGHSDCLKIQEEIVSRLVPGSIPSKVYEEVNSIINDMGFQEGFMGLDGNKVRFFGHGSGLVIDEYPVIAPKFDRPFETGMVIAVEPKKAFKGIGMVGIENTWLITDNGAEKITPGSDEIVFI